MTTVWDWVTLLALAGLATLLLQRSTAEQESDKLWHYAPPGIGLAVVNQLGNHGQAGASAQAEPAMDDGRPGQAKARRLDLG